MPVTVRILKSGEESLLTRVADDVFDYPLSPALIAEFLADRRHHIAVAIDAETVVGFVSAVDYVHPDKPAQLWINELSVAPAHRRRGIARTLMQAMFDHGCALGCREAWVGTETTNTAALRLYASLRESSSPQNFTLFEFDL